MGTKSYGAGTIGGGVLVLLGAFLPPAAAEAGATCGGRPATIVGSYGPDSLTGTAGDDVVWLGTGFDSFRGRAGDDIVCGGPGKDSLYGGSGDDRLYGGPGGDYNVVGSLGDDVVHGGAGDDMRLHGDDFDDDSGTDQVFGDAGDDTVDGEPGGSADAVDGGTGRDVISFYGGGRSVRIDVSAGTATGDAVDTVRGVEIHLGSEYADVITGSSDGDYLVGNGGDDTVAGRGGPDRLSATRGTIAGGPGRDTFVAVDEEIRGLRLKLGKGADRARLAATVRNSTFRGGSGDDVFQFPDPFVSLDSDGIRAELRGGRGTDRLTFAHNSHRVRLDARAQRGTWARSRVAFASFEEFYGSPRSDVLLGSRAAERMVGRRGDDVLRGRGGHDLLRGGKGRDSAYGDRGQDRCSAEIRVSCRP